MEAQDTLQKKYQIVLLTDNDAYLLQIKDGYYSSGIDLNLSTSSYNKKNKKIITTWQIQQKIYTPQSRRYYAQFGIDRPFAGYLHAAFIKNKFTSKNSLLKYGISLGTIGKNAQAKPVQDFIHGFMGFRNYNGWENEITNEANIQLQSTYVNRLFAKKQSAIAAIYPYAHTNIGNCFTHASSGIYFTLGKLENLFTSGLLDAYVETNTKQKKHKNEWLFFCRPQFMYQAYNATIQGGMFTKNNTGVTKTLNNFLFEQTWGFMYNTKNFGLHVGVTYQSKETVEQDRPQRFGTLGFAVRW